MAASIRAIRMARIAMTTRPSMSEKAERRYPSIAHRPFGFAPHTARLPAINSVRTLLDRQLLFLRFDARGRAIRGNVGRQLPPHLPLLRTRAGDEAIPRMYALLIDVSGTYNA